MSELLSYVIALYIRLSIEDSKVESMSIENQKIALHKYVDTMEGIKNVEVLEFIDNGYSGTNFERPAVQELLDAVRSGKIKCIIVKDFSRFGRNSIEVGYFMERVFPLYGIRFISINDSFDSDTLHGDTGGINVAFKYLVSEFYSRDLSVKSMSSKLVKMKRGEYQSSIGPYGYRKGANGRLEPDETTAPNVQLIFELAQRGCSAPEIAEELFRRSIPTPAEYKASIGKQTHDISRTGGIWQRSTILRILSDERYVGTYVIGKRRRLDVGDKRVRFRDESEWIKIPNHHPAIVNNEIYNQVQANRLHFSSVKRNNNVFPLKNKVYCGCCHHTLKRTNGQTRYFVCLHSKADSQAPCHGFRIQESVLESMLFLTITKRAKEVYDSYLSLPSKNIREVHVQHGECQQKINELKEMKRNLYEKYLLRAITAEDYKKEKSVLNREAEKTEQILDSLYSQVTRIQADDGARDMLGQLEKEISSAEALTIELADTLISRVLVYPDNSLDIEWKVRAFSDDCILNCARNRDQENEKSSIS